MQTFTARKDRVESEFAKRWCWRMVHASKRRAIVQIVAAEVGLAEDIESAVIESREEIARTVGLDPVTMWLIGQILSFVIRAIWEWAHSDE